MVQATAQPVGMVTGRVICEDTQHAARFANVTLFPVQQPAPAGERDGDRFLRRTPWISARTGLDGTFSVAGQPGDYYAQATAPGYLSVQGAAQEAISAGQTADQILARLPMVHISADGIAQVNITMARGASVSGQLVWEDGTPASGVSVMLIPVTPVKLPDALQGIAPLSFQGAMGTDDRGRFRLTGVAAGEYYLQAMLTARYATSQLSPALTNATLYVYAPGVMRKSEATTLKINHGEDRDDVRVVLDLGKLHTVSGHVSGLQAGSTGGSIFLRDTQESTLFRTGTVLPDGTFKVMYMPSGTYNVTVTGRGPDGSYGRGGRQVRGVTAASASSVQQTLTVGDSDVSGIEFTLPAPQ